MRFSWRDELIEDHVEQMLKLWKEVYCKVYAAPLKRIFKRSGIVDVDALVACSVIMHDVGKLTRLYQQHLVERLSLRGYRHEVLSSAITEIVFSRFPWSNYVSAAVLLSHEPILLGQVGRAGERYFSVTLANRSLWLVADENKRIRLEEDGVEALNKILKKEGFNVSLADEYSLSSCLDALRKILVKTSLLGNRHFSRIRIATLAHLLTLLDSLVASRNRRDDEGGTFVSKYARYAEVGEVWRR